MGDHAQALARSQKKKLEKKKRYAFLRNSENGAGHGGEGSGKEERVIIPLIFLAGLKGNQTSWAVGWILCQGTDQPGSWSRGKTKYTHLHSGLQIDSTL